MITDIMQYDLQTVS